MIEEFKKSVQSTLYERITSPLFGTFLLSWSVFNWKVFYVTFFVDIPESLSLSKIGYITAQLSNYNVSLLYPLFSTAALLIVYPIISIAAYRLDLYFKNIKIGLKQKAENNRLLTLDQANQIRLEVLKQKDEIAKYLKEKDSLVADLKQKNQALESKVVELTKEINAGRTVGKLQNKDMPDFSSFLKNKELVDSFKKAMEYYNKNQRIPLSIIKLEFEQYFVANRLFSSYEQNGRKLFNPTSKAEKYWRELINMEFHS